MLEIWLQVHRIRVKAAYDAKKAAKEADKLRRAHDRLLARQGEASAAFLFSQLWLIILFSQLRQHPAIGSVPKPKTGHLCREIM